MTRRRLLILTVIAVVIRVAFLVYLLDSNPDALLSRDSEDYYEPARELLATGAFAVDGEAEILRTPGYPLFLAPFMAVFGRFWIPAVVCAQFVLLLGVAAITYRLVELIPSCEGCDTASGLAYAIVLFEPTLFIAEYNIGSEILFVFTLTLGLYLLGRGLQQRQPIPCGAGIIVVTAATYVRPIGMYLPYLLCVGFGVYWLYRRDWRIAIALGVALLVHIAAIGVWKERNEAHFGVATFTTITEHNLYAYIGAAVQARATGSSWQDVREEFDDRKDGWDLNEAEKARRAGRIAKEIILDHPFEAAIIGLRGLAVNLFDPGTGQFANILGLRAEESGLMYRFNNMSPAGFFAYLVRNELPLLIFVGAGLVWMAVMWGGALAFLLLRKRAIGPAGWAYLLVAAYLLVVAAGPQSIARFRVPATPFIVVFTAAGLARQKPQRAIRAALKKLPGLQEPSREPQN